MKTRSFPRIAHLLIAALGLTACDDPELAGPTSDEEEPIAYGKADGAPHAQKPQQPRQPHPGEVIFVELMPNPAELSDHVAEWLELQNVTGEPLLLSGCRLTDRRTNPDRHFISLYEPLVIEPGEIALLAKTADPELNGGLVDVVDAFGDRFSLNSRADSPILQCNGKIVDEVTYDRDAWPFARGYSMRLDPDHRSAEANDAPSSWCAGDDAYYPDEYGSPGDSNLDC